MISFYRAKLSTLLIVRIAGIFVLRVLCLAKINLEKFTVLHAFQKTAPKKIVDLFNCFSFVLKKRNFLRNGYCSKKSAGLQIAKLDCEMQERLLFVTRRRMTSKIKKNLILVKNWILIKLILFHFEKSKLEACKSDRNAIKSYIFHRISRFCWCVTYIFANGKNKFIFSLKWHATEERYFICVFLIKDCASFESLQ